MDEATIKSMAAELAKERWSHMFEQLKAYL